MDETKDTYEEADDSPHFRPLAINLVNEGELVKRIDSELLKIQEYLTDYAQQHKDAAVGAKAKLTVELVVAIGDKEGKSVHAKANCKLTLPSAPALVSLAMGIRNRKGQGRFFVRTSGSDESTPRQRKLCTQSGERIDLETGEVIKADA